MAQTLPHDFFNGALELPNDHELLKVDGTRHPVRYGIILGGSQRWDVAEPALSPYNAVALIKLFRPGIPAAILTATGFLCRQDVMLTAKHVVTAFQPGDRAGIWLGYDTQRNPKVQPIAVIGSAIHPTLDLAVVFLGTPQTNNFELGAPPPFHGATVMLGGYGLDYANGATRLSWGSGPVNALQIPTASIAYLISTRPGDSGAPVFIMNNGVPTAIGLHTGAADDPAIGNSGIYLSPQVIADINLLIAHNHPKAAGGAA